MRNIIGIDLGTTNSLVATLDREQPVIIPNRMGKRMTPSVVGLDRSDKLHVGETARNQLVTMPDRTIAEVKRKMGTSDKVTLGSRTYTPTEVSGIILTALREDAERHFGAAVTEAVITVPAYFTDSQRQATRDAGELAGLKVERIINEPTAAALAYGLGHLDKEQYVLVYDLGGGTFDVSVLEMFQGVLDVKASAGNNQLGGGDFDRAIAAWLAAEFERMHGVSLAGNAAAQARLKTAAEQAKMELSALDTTPVMLPFLAAGPGGPLSLEVELTRKKLEELIGALVRSTIEPLEAALRDAKLGREAITDIVLVGGSSRVPLVRTMLQDYFKRDLRGSVNPDEAVALGAAVQAGLKSGAISAQHGIMITDVNPFTLGVEVSSRVGNERLEGIFSPIIPRNTTVPVSRTEIYSTTGDGQRAVNIKVFQGESKMVRNNVFLDEYTIDGVPPGPSGSEKVAVTFTYDVNGILHVSTKIASTGKEAKLVIDKSPRRMGGEERAEAKQRLNREWGSPPPPPGAAPAPVAAPAPSPAPAPAPAPAAAATADVKALIARAQEQLATLQGDKREKLAALLESMKRALVTGDTAELARLDVQLTDALFELL